MNKLADRLRMWISDLGNEGADFAQFAESTRRLGSTHCAHSPRSDLVRYTPVEETLLEGIPPRVRTTLDIIKTTFADMGEATVFDVRRHDRVRCRSRIASILRRARRTGLTDRAVSVRDAVKERLSICVFDGVDEDVAWGVALNEVEAIDRPRNGA